MVYSWLKNPVRPFRLETSDHDIISRSLLLEERQRTRSARGTIGLCVLLCSAFVAWAALAPIHEVVTANGALLPSAEMRAVQHLEGGIVSEILVRPGDRIEAGEPIARLDGAQTRAELAKAQVRLETLTLSADRLRAMATGDKKALIDDGSLAAIVESQRAAWRSAQLHLAAQLEVLAAERTAKEARLPSLLAQRKTAGEELRMLRKQLADFDSSLSAGLTLRRDRDEAARAVLELQRDIAELDGTAAELRAGLASLSARETELVSSMQREAFDEVASLEAQRMETEALVQQLSERLTRLDIGAPISGIVQSVAIKGSSEVIHPGQTVAEIVPVIGPVLARVEVPAERIGSIGPGTEARVRVLTYDYTRFGTLDAVVEQISPTSFVGGSGQHVYEVRLRLASEFVGPETAGLTARPGMTISVDMTGSEKTVLAYLLKPLRVLADRSLTEM